MKKNKLIYLLIASTVFILSLRFIQKKIVSSKSTELVQQIRGTTMGTYYVVKYLTNDLDGVDKKWLENQISLDLNEINRQMSTYQDDSEISLLNKHKMNTVFLISPWFYEVLEFSLYLAKKTSGAFDPTVGPLVNYWGFGPEKKTILPNNNEELKKILKYVGYSKIRLTKNGVVKNNPKIYLDLSSVAKGFAVDKISDRLQSLGLINHLVEIGGEIKALGTKANQEWLIGVESPSQENSIQKIIKLRNLSIATSGPYRNYKSTKENIISHTVDPKTGDAKINELLSVSVLSKKCMHADALATALLVMGYEKALEYSKNNKIPVYLIYKDKGKISTKMNELFQDFVLRSRNNV